MRNRDYRFVLGRLLGNDLLGCTRAQQTRPMEE